MSCTGSPFRRILGVLLCLIVLGSGEAYSQCNYPIVRVFGANDWFVLNQPDPIPYNPALPQFVAFLNSIGIPPATLKTFDNPTINRHMVATLRHGLRHCFAPTRQLTLCFRARADHAGAFNDGLVIYNTNFTNSTFPVVYSSAIVPALRPTWTTGNLAWICIPLTAQMQAGSIGEMLQFRIQDDTRVDFIRMVLQ